MLTIEEIRIYWENRVKSDPSAQSTTDDVYLRAIELRVLIEWIKRLNPAEVLDIGCGDGRTTIGVARAFPSLKLWGVDYSNAMIERAKENVLAQGIRNVHFKLHDIRESLDGYFDLAYTTRCLINLPDWELQRLALRNIHQALHVGSCYLMIENFMDGHENLNRIRKDFGLPEITVRNHNLFFERDKLLLDIDELFSVEEEINISSTYYLVSRVVYSRICADNGVKPDYFNEHHRYASQLPFSGEFGPLRMLVLKKK